MSTAAKDDLFFPAEALGRACHPHTGKFQAMQTEAELHRTQNDDFRFGNSASNTLDGRSKPFLNASSIRTAHQPGRDVSLIREIERLESSTRLVKLEQLESRNGAIQVVHTRVHHGSAPARYQESQSFDKRARRLPFAAMIEPLKSERQRAVDRSLQLSIVHAEDTGRCSSAAQQSARIDRTETALQVCCRSEFVDFPIRETTLRHAPQQSLVAEPRLPLVGRRTPLAVGNNFQS